ncbi:MAG TPA: hypothetical protein VLD13_10020, partial [Gaiellaceae bacterium]|nr:hypothetical protein [Gaiellaceae bacterium]
RKSEHEPLLGAVSAGDADLGPVSPELALVDPELARRARELLPEPREQAKARPPVAAAPVVESRPAEAPAPPIAPELRERRRRWPRALLLAAAIFAAGGASGTFLRTEDAGPPATALEVRADAPPPPTPTQPTSTRQATVQRPALRPPKVSAKSQPKTTTMPAAPQRRRHARVVWASNVLGVTAQVDRLGVELGWQRPAGSSHVVVTRRRAHGGPSVVVYRGWATSSSDASTRPCTAYRYTIVNYDRKGRRSTGVPTSVVTRCG